VRVLGVLTVAFLLLTPTNGLAASSMARTDVFSGYAFDACSAPALASIQAWSASPYRAVGVYIGGVNRACKQSNLTPTWVQTTVGLGWSLLPLYVGLQAPCVSQSGLSKIAKNTTTAATQGREAADDAATDATALGLPAGSPIWFDMEGYHLGDAACTSSVQSFAAAWNAELSAAGFVPGIYGSAASTIRDVSVGAAAPQLVWIANWNGVQSVFGDPYVSDSLWTNHQRIHQYKGGHRETYGGVTIDIDSNVVDSTVVGSAAPAPVPPTPAPAGQVNSGDGLATVTWPADAFTTQVLVTLTPTATPPVPNGYAVQLAVVESDNQAPVDGFGAPVTVHILKPPAGLIPAFSSDGATWQQLPELTSAGLSDQVLTAYTVDPDGTYEIQSLVPGYFGLVTDTTPPSTPAVSGRLLPSGLYLRWAAATDNGQIASYTVLRNGKPFASLTGAARSATVRHPATAAQTVYRVQAIDTAGNVGVASRAVVILAKKRPAGLPHAIPQWAFGLFAYQRHQGARPARAPKRPPAWYWRWAAWRAQPYRLR
jgi:Rv2525c-like, glycoside hydrolase-like domain